MDPAHSRGSQCIARVLIALLLLTACVPALTQTPAPGGAVPVSPCQGDSQPQAVRQARAVLEQDPEALAPRLKLADALLDQGCNQDAAAVLEAAEKAHPHSNELETKLREVHSMLTEQQYIEGLDRAQESAKLQRNLLRCAQLADVSACDEALRSRPGDVQVLLAKGDALLQGNHPADAIGVYRHAWGLSPGSEIVRTKLAAAEAQRQTLVLRCESGSGATALQACDAALLRGAEDEFTIDRRKGVLLQSMNQPGLALDSYIAADVLRQDDEAVALAIVALTDSTGRKDALALAARGAALLTLGKPEEALADLRQARSLTPSLPGLDLQIATAQDIARTRVRRVDAEPATAAVSSSADAHRAVTRSVARASVSGSKTASAPSVPVVQNEPPAEKRTYSNEEPPEHTN